MDHAFSIPALFFVSGMTYRTINRDMLINSLFKLSCVFTILSVILNGLYAQLSWGSVWKPLFLVAIDVPKFFLSVQQSYWFVSVYVAVLIIATIILKKFRAGYGLIMLGCMCLYFYCFFAKKVFLEGKILGESFQQVFFYLSVFLFGFFCKDKVIGRAFQKEVAALVLVIAVGVTCLTYLSEGEFIFNLFLNKFPARLPFIALSFISISLGIFFYRSELKNFLLEHIGKNAVYYYAGQGVGASLLYPIVANVLLPVYFKLPLMFLLNILITAFVAEVIKFIYTSCGICYKRIVSSVG